MKQEKAEGQKASQSNVINKGRNSIQKSKFKEKEKKALQRNNRVSK